MNGTELRLLAARELSFMKAGLDITAAALEPIRRDTSHPALRIALEKGGRALSEWNLRIGRAIEQIGSMDEVKHSLLWTHYDMSRERRAHAASSTARDLTIVADGQVALHYWIAAFSTMAHYARVLGLENTASEMQASAEEATTAVEGQRFFAVELLGHI